MQKERNEKIIYTLKLARYLLELGFEFKRTTPDPFRKGYSNWIFDNSPELNEAVEIYLHNQGD